MALVLSSANHPHSVVHQIVPNLYLGNCASRAQVRELGIQTVLEIGTEEELRCYLLVPLKTYAVSISESRNS